MKIHQLIPTLSLLLTLGIVSCNKTQEAVVTPETTSTNGGRATATTYPVPPSSVTVGESRGSLYYIKDSKYTSVAIHELDAWNPYRNVWLKNGLFSLSIEGDGTLNLVYIMKKVKTFTNCAAPGCGPSVLSNTLLAGEVQPYYNGKYIIFGKPVKEWKWEFNGSGLANVIYPVGTSYGDNRIAWPFYANGGAHTMHLSTKGTLQIFNKSGTLLWEST